MLNLQITSEELNLLTSLAADQLFRREFIDPKMPGYQRKPEEIKLGKGLIDRLKLIIDSVSEKRALAHRITA